ncbi:hypothetical protein [Agromyces sp. LHK192]|uniref:hypothetical protein n=1 Tax=Agromyces sp. LHK192 TaxID=2498704 RepID=UPI000FD829BD|nr:hypothetical protein [Agromyces sp. LHK192]
MQALSSVLPTMQDWIFAIHREIDVHPVLAFREYLREIGLLRRFKGIDAREGADRDERQVALEDGAGSIAAGLATAAEPPPRAGREYPDAAILGIEYAERARR